MQASVQPMIVAWGPERVLLYNDGYIPILRHKHPWAFGRPFFEVWPEVRAEVGALFERVFAGESVQMDDIAATLNRGESQEEAHFSFSYTPVRGEDGAVAGLFCTCNEITERVLARQRLENERVRQQQMLQQMPGFVAMLSGPDHRFQYVNGAFTALAGSRAVAGRPVREVFPEIEGQGFFEPLDEVFRSGVAFSARAAPVRFSGEQDTRYIDLNFEAIRDDSGQITGVFVGGYDVTEVERSAAALRKSETLLAAIVASSDDAIISKTMDGVVTSWNAGAERLFGYCADEMIGQSIARLCVDEREDEMSRILERLSKDERIENFETVRRHKTGAEVFVSLTVSPIHDEAGRVIGASKMARDITAARASTDALKRAQDRLRTSTGSCFTPPVWGSSARCRPPSPMRSTSPSAPSSITCMRARVCCSRTDPPLGRCWRRPCGGRRNRRCAPPKWCAAYASSPSPTRGFCSRSRSIRSSRRPPPWPP
jgi:PAS domain S-box-containing protein